MSNQKKNGPHLERLDIPERKMAMSGLWGEGQQRQSFQCSVLSIICAEQWVISAGRFLLHQLRMV